MTAKRWCSRCRRPREMEWEEDISFGASAESVRCPICGAVWGVRARRSYTGTTEPPVDATDTQATETAPVRRKVG